MHCSVTVLLLVDAMVLVMIVLGRLVIPCCDVFLTYWGNMYHHEWLVFLFYYIIVMPGHIES